MSKSICLTICHNIFLTKDERYELAEGGRVKVMGVSVPVWLLTSGKTTEPAEEVFCWYHIENSDKLKIATRKKGYKMSLPSPMFQRLRDVTNEGSECMMFTNHNFMDVHGEKTYSINYVSIQDIDMLTRVMV